MERVLREEELEQVEQVEEAEEGWAEVTRRARVETVYAQAAGPPYRTQ